MGTQDRDAPAVGAAPTILLGPAGSGKTALCLERLREREAAGMSGIALVPEQTTYLFDRALLEPPGPRAIRHVRVLSFRRLAHDLEPDEQARLPVLDAAQRRILLRALAGRLPAEIRRPWDRLLDRSGFLESLAGLLRDLRFEAESAGADRIAELLASAELPSAVRGKLRLAAALREVYDATLAARGLRDPELALVETPGRILERADRFRGVPVYVDGFLSFTRLEEEILVCLRRAGARLYLTLCLDPELAARTPDHLAAPPSLRADGWPRTFLESLPRPVFLAPLRTYVELRARFHAAGFPTRTESVPEAGSPPRFRSADLRRLAEDLLSAGPGGPDAPPADIRLAAARDPADEVEIWARTIDRWIRLDPDPVRPGEIAVIVRDLDLYRPLVAETFARTRIPVFVDRHRDLSARPLARTILAAFDLLLAGWTRDAVLSFLRSPLLGTHGGEVDLLELLSIEDGRDFEDWTGPAWPPIPRLPRTRFVRNEKEETAEDPEGDSEREIEETVDPGRIEEVRAAIANRLRAAHLEPLRRLGETWAAGSATGTEAVAAIRRWIEEAGLRERAAERAEPGGAETAREWEAVDRLLDSLAGEIGADRLGLDGLVRLFRAGLDSLRLGRTPTGLDAVVLAEVQRSRLGPVRCAIVGGLTASSFPRMVEGGGFLNESDRARLRASGLDLGAPAFLRQEEEEYLFYIAATRASRRLLMTRPTTDLEGGTLAPSPYLRRLRRSFPGLVETIPRAEQDPADLETVQTSEELAAHVGAYLASRLERSAPAAARAAAPQDPAETDRRILGAYDRLVAPGGSFRNLLGPARRLWEAEEPARLDPRAIGAAFPGRVVPASAGRLETFGLCPYKHFARSLLRLEPRPRGEVTPIENGLLAHRALELFHRMGPPPKERREIEEALRPIFSRIEKEQAFRAYAFDPSGSYRLRTARAQLLRHLQVEALRLERSAFRPALFEQEFGTEDVRPLRLPLTGGGALLLRGRIDRIDLTRSVEPLEALVLDYKSGNPKESGRGRPADVEQGFDLQLAVYLLVAEEILGYRPFGGLYVPVLPRPVSAPGRDPENPLGLKMRGILPADRAAEATGGMDLLRQPRSRSASLPDRAALDRLLRSLRDRLARLAEAILAGRIDAYPVRRGSRLPCERCEYGPVCRFDARRHPSRRTPFEGLIETDRG